MINVQKLLEFVNGEIVYTDWLNPFTALKLAKNIEACNYFIQYSKKRPLQNAWDFDKHPAFRIGTSCGKGYGSKGDDQQYDDTYRQKRRKVTSQPYDRLHGHIKNMKEGIHSNEYKKNWGNAQKAWSPVFKKYGWGPKLLERTWISFAIPNDNLLFDQQVLRCELVELAHILNHKVKFNNEAPMTDIKYANASQKEVQNLLALKYNQSGRLTRISNDKEYIDRETQNNSAFTHNLETITGKKLTA